MQTLIHFLVFLSVNLLASYSVSVYLKRLGFSLNYETIRIDFLLGTFLAFLGLKGFYSFSAITDWVVFLVYYVISLFLFYSDLKTSLLPDIFHSFLLLMGGVLLFINQDLVEVVFGLIVGGGCLLSLKVVGDRIYRREVMGWGDIKLAGIIGFVWGSQIVINTIYLAFIFGGIVGGVLLMFKLVSREKMVPFGPFLIVASYISILMA